MVRGRIGVTFAAVVISALMVSVASASAEAQTKLTKPLASFPISITKSGSYILATTLQVGGRTLNAINVSAPNVTIDLNGFSIIGPGAGVGVGINAGGASNVTVENGSVTNMGGSGIKVGDNGVVRNVGVIGNGTGSGLGGRDGIDCTGSGCLVTGCTANSNLLGDGINFLDGTSGYANNIMNGNSSPVSGGINMGGNVCNGALCP